MIVLFGMIVSPIRVSMSWCHVNIDMISVSLCLERASTVDMQDSEEASMMLIYARIPLRKAPLPERDTRIMARWVDRKAGFPTEAFGNDG
jgi:hypothetical protein